MTSEHFLECVVNDLHVRKDGGEADPCCCGVPMCGVEIPVRADTIEDRAKMHRKARNWSRR